jgi:hypothetical protein
MVNLSTSIPFDVAKWLEDFAKLKNLYTNGKPSLGKAASLKLQEVHEKELKRK